MTVEEVYKELNKERDRKLEILGLIEEIEYERYKSVQAVTYDQERVQGGGGANSNPFLNPTAKILELEDKLVALKEPTATFEQMIKLLPVKYRKVIIGFYGNCKTIREIREDWDSVSGVDGKRPSPSSLKTWKREAVKHIAEHYKIKKTF